MENQVDYLIERLMENISYDIREADVFVFGYKELGQMVTEKLLLLGVRVRVGGFLDNNIVDPANDNITYVYSNKMETIKRFIHPDDIVINTIPYVFSGNDDSICKSKHIVDIDNYTNNYQKTYIKK